MKYRLHILFLTTYYLLLVTFAHAQDSKSLFQTANEYYKTKQYEEAEKMYLLLLKKDKQNANAFYNLGNTYYHLKQYSNAVLYYEKAKKIQPDDKKIQHNIELTNNKLFSKIEFSKEFFVTKQIKETVKSKPSKSWSIFMFIALWLGVILMCVHFFFSNKTLYRIGMLACLLSILFAYFTYSAFELEHQNNFAIIMQQNAYMKTAPVESMNAATAVQVGLKVEIIDSDKNWRKIKLPNGKTGWIEISQIEFI
jgi:tetratricopeptide (TPR) repeat protein